MASSSKVGNSRIMRNGSKVAPAPRTCDDIVEIRPGRKIRIRHLNPKQRDDKFAKEMEVYLRARQNGLIDGVFMPPRHPQGNKGSKTVNETAKSTVSLNYKKENSLDIDSKSNVEVKDPENIHSKGEPAEQISANNKTVNRLSHEDRKENVDNIVKSENELKTRDTEATGWVSKAIVRQQANLVSPSRVSVAPSDGIQSTSGILVSMSRPTSEIAPTDIATRTQNKKPIEVINLADGHAGSESPRADSVKSTRTPRKTKDHRPVSAKNIRGAKSLASSEVGNDLIAELSDFDSPVKHRASSFKDVTLFFIHGVGGSADVWNSQLDFIASFGIEAIAPDLLGHGLSSCPNRAKDYFFNEILADVEAVFDKYCKRQNIIIAHSYG